MRVTVEGVLKPLTLQKMQVVNYLILGYSNTHEYTTEDSDGEDQPGSSTNYNDANWNWLGSSWEDYYGSGYSSIVVEDGVRIDSGNFLSYAFDSEGARVEVDGNPEISEQSSYEFRFDVETGEMLGGTQVNGPTTITYGANFEIESSVTEIDTTGGDFTLVDGSGLPAAFIDSLDLPEGMRFILHPMIWVGVLRLPIILLVLAAVVCLVIQLRMMKAQ